MEKNNSNNSSIIQQKKEFYKIPKKYRMTFTEFYKLDKFKFIKIMNTNDSIELYNKRTDLVEYTIRKIENIELSKRIILFKDLKNKKFIDELSSEYNIFRIYNTISNYIISKNINLYLK